MQKEVIVTVLFGLRFVVGMSRCYFLFGPIGERERRQVLMSDREEKQRKVGEDEGR